MVGWCAVCCSFQRDGPVIFDLLADRNLLHMRQIRVGSRPVCLSHSSFLSPSLWEESRHD